jgi:hypothetical protein
MIEAIDDHRHTPHLLRDCTPSSRFVQQTQSGLENPDMRHDASKAVPSLHPPSEDANQALKDKT